MVVYDTSQSPASTSSKEDLEALSPTITRGTLHYSEPIGSMRNINGIQTYYIKPPSRSVDNAILLFTDATGIGPDKNKVLADNFAANGYFVVMPDLFRGDAMPLVRPENWSQTMWYRKHLPSHVEPIVRTVLMEMKDSGARVVGGVGYGIGAKYLARFMKAAGLRACFMGHPTWVDKEDILAIERPTSIAFGGNGSVSAEQRRDIEKMLSEDNLEFQTVFYSSSSHQSTGRNYDRFTKEQMFHQAIQWLNFYMK